MSRIERLRNTASSLLRQLRQARAECLARQAEAEQPDPMTQIRGRSAMDDAVSETEGLIARIDTLLSTAPASQNAPVGGRTAVQAKASSGRAMQANHEARR